jgi:hypothetical protein
MTRRELLRMQLAVLRIDLKERLYDLANIGVPVFIVSGLLVGSIKFWWWLL